MMWNELGGMTRSVQFGVWKLPQQLW